MPKKFIKDSAFSWTQRNGCHFGPKSSLAHSSSSQMQTLHQRMHVGPWDFINLERHMCSEQKTYQALYNEPVWENPSSMNGPFGSFLELEVPPTLIHKINDICLSRLIFTPPAGDLAQGLHALQAPQPQSVITRWKSSLVDPWVQHSSPSPPVGELA